MKVIITRAILSILLASGIMFWWYQAISIKHIPDGEYAIRFKLANADEKLCSAYYKWEVQAKDKVDGMRKYCEQLSYGNTHDKQ